MSYYSLTSKEVLNELKTSEKGLTSKEAEERLQKYGQNVLEDEAKIRPWRIFVEQFKSPVVWVLLGAMIITFFLKEFIDFWVIFAVVIINAIFGFWQEYKAEESLTAIGLMGKIVPAGDYRIKVYSPSNLGKYSLVTGYLESFPFTEILNALILVPKLKLNFFNKPLSEILFAPFVLGPVILVSLLSVGAYILRLKYKNLYPKKNTVRDNDLKIF